MNNCASRYAYSFVFGRNNCDIHNYFAILFTNISCEEMWINSQLCALIFVNTHSANKHIEFEFELQDGSIFPYTKGLLLGKA